MYLMAVALALWPPQSLSLPLFRDIAQSGDVAWLERLCTDQRRLVRCRVHDDIYFIAASRRQDGRWIRDP